MTSGEYMYLPRSQTTDVWGLHQTSQPVIFGTTSRVSLGVQGDLAASLSQAHRHGPQAPLGTGVGTQVERVPSESVIRKPASWLWKTPRQWAKRGLRRGGRAGNTSVSVEGRTSHSPQRKPLAFTSTSSCLLKQSNRRKCLKR